MPAERRTRHWIMAGLAVFLLICGVPMVSAEENNGTFVVNTTSGNDPGNGTVIADTTVIIPVTETPVPATTATPVQTILQTLTTIISPTPTPLIGTTPDNTSTPVPTDSPVASRTPMPEIIPTVTVTDTAKPVMQQKSLSPAVQRKISTNLLYIIDSSVPETGISRDAVQDQMEAEGKLMTVTQETTTAKSGIRAAAAAEPAANLVLVYIDLVPSAPASVVDAYVSSVTERNEQDHSVVAWVDINNLDTLASLDAVSNVRTAEPSVTKESPVYHDTKFVNKRAGLPPATVDEAKASVREFEDAPGMALEQKRTMSTPRGEVYEMVSDRGRYFVNAKTGEVELASFYGKQKLHIKPSMLLKSTGTSKEQSTNTITMDEAIVLAQNYADKNNKNFYNRTMVLTKSELLDHGDAGMEYYLIWMEKINEVTIPNGVIIFLDANTGDINSYISFYHSINTNIVPTVSKDTAISKATAIFSYIDEAKTETHLLVKPVSENVQRTVWEVWLTGKSQDDFVIGGEVLIDAHTGEIVSVSPYA